MDDGRDEPADAGNASRRLSGAGLAPLCPVINVPVLITAGRHSGALPGCLYAAEHIPGAKLVVFEQSGHCPFYTEASRFNQSVADFVNGIRRG